MCPALGMCACIQCTICMCARADGVTQAFLFAIRKYSQNGHDGMAFGIACGMMEWHGHDMMACIHEMEEKKA